MLNASIVSLNLNTPNFSSENKVAFTERAEAVLDNSERARYKRFRHDNQALPFLAGRLLVKTTLAERLGCAAGDVQLKLSSNGKPTLIDDSSQWQFSISHAQGRVLVAIANCRLGIDLESEQRFNARLISNPRFFSQALVTDLAKRDKASKVAAQYWTAIEAIVKLEDSSVFTERAHFDFMLDEQNCYPFRRQRALVSWQEDEAYIASLSLETEYLSRLSLSFTEFCSGSEIKKSILSWSSGLQLHT